MLVIGDSGVGKTSLLVRFDEDKFSPNFITTIGIDYRTRMVDMENKKVKLQIWDTGGQERFKTITMTYFRGAHGIILVYDVTDPLSFENIRSWMANLQANASSDVDRILIGNKCDMADKRVISTQRGQDLANEFGIPFFETSAKSSINVEECFMSLAKDCFNRLKNDGAAPSTTGGKTITLDSTTSPSTSNGDQKPCAC
jgi:Ras-related protein Rab-8A